MSSTRSFSECLQFGNENRTWWEAQLKRFYTRCARLEWNDTDRPDEGIDVIVHLTGGHTVNVDVKRIAQRNWLLGWQRTDQPVVLLEYVSSPGRPGWAEKSSKTDVLLYGCIEEDECIKLPFLDLQEAWSRHKEDWVKRAEAKQDGFWMVGGPTTRLSSLSVCVPLKTLIHAINRTCT